MVITETMGLKLRGEPRVNIRTGSYKDISAAPAEPAVEPAASPLGEASSSPEGAPGYAAYEEVVLSPGELSAPPLAEDVPPSPAQSTVSAEEEE
jgi:hypothetical protein